MELIDLWPNNEWNVLNSLCETRFFLPKCCPGIFFPEVNFILKFKRRSTAYRYLMQWPIFCSIAFNCISLFIKKSYRWIRFQLNQISFVTLLTIAVYLSFTLGINNFAQTKLGKEKLIFIFLQTNKLRN